MKYIILILFPLCTNAAELPPTPFPIFLKSGFSSVLDFDDTPSQVVLGDAESFQVEKLKQSIVLKPLQPYATTNMFVYFRNKKTRLFILTASEDAEPTYYKSFKTPPPPKVTVKKVVPKMSWTNGHSTKLVGAWFDKKKDYLTVDLVVSANSQAPINPKWDWVRLSYKSAAITPMKLWAERQTVQKDSSVKARFIFAKANIPRNLKGVTLIVPIHGSLKPVGVPLRLVKP
jgi:hypothetical protein